MKFGPCKTADAENAILAHSVLAGKRRIRKGTRLTVADIADLQGAGVAQVVVAVLADGDVGEDMAAKRLALALIAGLPQAQLRISAPFAGRVNIYAQGSGLIRVNAVAVNRLNALSHAVCVATLADLSRVRANVLVATVKIIPFGVPGELVDAACLTAPKALGLAPFLPKDATLILTRTPGMKATLLTKGQAAVTQRLAVLQSKVDRLVVVPHEIGDLAAALRAARGDLVLILTASATSDENDVGPAALAAAGGELIRFGMPVDPGNLLFLGRLGDKTIIGLPGCARSPALNGADWVLERLACGIDVSADDIGAMGVGGLLKEIATRPQPRGATPQVPVRPHIEVILLAAGASSRMGGVDKLLEEIDGEPLLRHAARVALGSDAGRVHVVLPPDHAQRRDALSGLGVHIVDAPDWQEGMSASIRAGLGALTPQCDAVVIALADMPDITPDHLNRLMAAFDAGEGREICRAVAQNGTPGHPVLFGRRFFETLGNLSGDRGGRDVLNEAPEFLVDVPTAGQGALTDLDTPQDWANWRAR